MVTEIVTGVTRHLILRVNRGRFKVVFELHALKVWCLTFHTGVLNCSTLSW